MTLARITSRTALLEAVRDILILSPEWHDQRLWAHTVDRGGTSRHVATVTPKWVRQSAHTVGTACGTIACVAGWAAILSAPDEACIIDGAVWDSGGWKTMFDYACEAMGLYRDQASWMFAADRTRSELIDALDALIKDPNALIEDPKIRDWSAIRGWSALRIARIMGSH